MYIEVKKYYLMRCGGAIEIEKSTYIDGDFCPIKIFLAKGIHSRLCWFEDGKVELKSDLPNPLDIVEELTYEQYKEIVNTEYIIRRLISFRELDFLEKYETYLKMTKNIVEYGETFLEKLKR